MSHRAVATAVLAAISAFGANSIIGLIFRNGWMAMNDELMARPDPVLPGTGGPARTYFTGIAALDEAITGILKFFFPCVSGELPSLSFFSAYMAGQILPMHTALLLESLRAGNKGTLFAFPAVWGMVYQNIPWGIILPLYAIAYIWLSPLAQPSQGIKTSRSTSVLSMNPAWLQTAADAMILGFIIPTILPALPSPSWISRDRQQIFLALWQAFPVWVSLSHLFLAKVTPKLGLIANPDDASPAASLPSLRQAYGTILKYTSLVHFGVLAVATFPQLRLANAASLKGRISLVDIFVPSSAISPRQVETMAEGTLSLLQYDMYCAGGAMLFLVAYLAYAVNGPDAAAGLKTLTTALRRSLVVGPGGAVLWALWDRDEEAMAEGGKVVS
ncbi:hypothetical protein ACHAQA_005868 [Verticillium albo-atrum]